MIATTITTTSAKKEHSLKSSQKLNYTVRRKCFCEFILSEGFGFPPVFFYSFCFQFNCWITLVYTGFGLISFRCRLRCKCKCFLAYDRIFYILCVYLYAFFPFSHISVHSFAMCIWYGWVKTSTQKIGKTEKKNSQTRKYFICVCGYKIQIHQIRRCRRRRTYRKEKNRTHFIESDQMKMCTVSATQTLVVGTHNERKQFNICSTAITSMALQPRKVNLTDWITLLQHCIYLCVNFFLSHFFSILTFLHFHFALFNSMSCTFEFLFIYFYFRLFVCVRCSCFRFFVLFHGELF